MVSMMSAEEEAETPLLDLVPVGRALTAYEVAQLPDIRGRFPYELIDGVLSVMAGPSFEHQSTQGNLFSRLAAAAPRPFRVLAAPFDILSEDTAVQPDLIVMDRSWRGGEWLETVPYLIVEILSPSTAARDLSTKFERYERAGVASYWVVDPIQSRLVVWELYDGAYVKVADVRPGQTWTASRPFEVTIEIDRIQD